MGAVMEDREREEEGGGWLETSGEVFLAVLEFIGELLGGLG